MTPRLWQTGLLALGLTAACGGSASRHEPDAPPPSPVAGAAGEPAHTAGGNATAGGAIASAGGGNGSSTSSGGAPAGGSPVGGAATVLTLPPGCQPRTPTETADLCSLGVDCDTSPPVRTYCHRLDSGRWECQCANQDRIYQLEDAAGLQACALAAQLCSDEELELGDESCERTNESRGQDSCAADIACGSPISLAATTGARAWLMRSGGVRCDRMAPAETFGCTCSNGAMRSDYSLLAASGELACGPFADFCVSGAAPVFDGDEVCVPGYFSSDSEGCQRFAGCGPQMRLTDEVSLAKFEQRFATCVPKPSGGSDCSCSNEDSAFLFQVSTPPNDATCTSSIANCDPNAVIETVGPARCEPLGLDAPGGDQCGAQLTCAQDVTVDNRSLVTQGRMSLVCRRAGPGMPWSCSCVTDRKTARVALGAASADGAQACTQASPACLESLGGLHLGVSHDPITPPDPVL